MKDIINKCNIVLCWSKGGRNKKAEQNAQLFLYHYFLNPKTYTITQASSWRQYASRPLDYRIAHLVDSSSFD